MPMTVRELLDDPRLDLRVVVDGALDRPIRWVHTTELADPTRYLQGGELILTTGVWRDAGVTSEGFVRRWPAAWMSRPWATASRRPTATCRPIWCAPAAWRGFRSSPCHLSCRSSRSRGRSSTASTAAARTPSACASAETTSWCARPATAPASRASSMSSTRGSRPGSPARARRWRRPGRLPRMTMRRPSAQLSRASRPSTRSPPGSGSRSRSSPWDGRRPTWWSRPAGGTWATTTGRRSTRRCRSSASSWPVAAPSAKASDGWRQSWST